MSYKLGTVYRIVCLSNPELPPYIGSTFNELRHRWTQHKQDYQKYLKGGKFHNLSIYPYFSLYGIENFKIIKIKEYLVYREHEKDRKHLSVYEQLWLNKLKNLNKFRAFNIKHIYFSNYDKNRKNKKKEYNSQIHYCPCGKTITLHSKSRHEKTKKHQAYLESLIEVEV